MSESKVEVTVQENKTEVESTPAEQVAEVAEVKKEQESQITEKQVSEPSSAEVVAEEEKKEDKKPAEPKKGKRNNRGKRQHQNKKPAETKTEKPEDAAENKEEKPEAKKEEEKKPLQFEASKKSRRIMNQQRSIIRNAKNNREVRVVSNDLVPEETSNEEVSEDQPKVVMPTFKLINEYKRKRDRERFQGIRDGTISFPEQRRRAPQREVKKEEHPQTEQPTVTEKPKRENKRRNNRRKNTPPKEEQPVETAEEPTRLLAHLNLSFDGDKTVTITVYDGDSAEQVAKKYVEEGVVPLSVEELMNIITQNVPENIHVV